MSIIRYEDWSLMPLLEEKKTTHQNTVSHCFAKRSLLSFKIMFVGWLQFINFNHHILQCCLFSVFNSRLWNTAQIINIIIKAIIHQDTWIILRILHVNMWNSIYLLRYWEDTQASSARKMALHYTAQVY